MIAKERHSGHDRGVCDRSARGASVRSAHDYWFEAFYDLLFLGIDINLIISMDERLS